MKLALDELRRRVAAALRAAGAHDDMATSTARARVRRTPVRKAFSVASAKRAASRSSPA